MPGAPSSFLFRPKNHRDGSENEKNSPGGPGEKTEQLILKMSVFVGGPVSGVCNMGGNQLGKCD